MLPFFVLLALYPSEEDNQIWCSIQVIRSGIESSGSPQNTQLSCARRRSTRTANSDCGCPSCRVGGPPATPPPPPLRGQRSRRNGSTVAGCGCGVVHDQPVDRARGRLAAERRGFFRSSKRPWTVCFLLCWRLHSVTTLLHSLWLPARYPKSHRSTHIRHDLGPWRLVRSRRRRLDESINERLDRRAREVHENGRRRSISGRIALGPSPLDSA